MSIIAVKLSHGILCYYFLILISASSLVDCLFKGLQHFKCVRPINVLHIYLTVFGNIYTSIFKQ